MEVQSRLVGINAVDATHGENAIFLVFQLSILLLRYVATAYCQFAPQNLYQEIAVAAGGLQETGINTLGLVLDQIEHSVHLARGGKHFAMFCTRSRDLMPVIG